MEQLKSISFKKYFVIATLVSVLAFLCSAFISQGRIFQSYIFIDTIDSGMDFFNSMAYTRGGHPYTQYGTLYPPLANLFFYILTFLVPPSVKDSWGNSFDELIQLRGTPSDLRVQQAPMFIYFAFITAVVLLILYNYLSRDKWKSPKTNFVLAICFILSFPYITGLERGNITILTLALLLYYLFNFDSDVALKRELALICLALATGFKLYPVVFGALLLIEKKWMPALRAAIYCFIAVFAPLLILDGKEGLIIFVSKTLNSASAAGDSTSEQALQLTFLGKIAKALPSFMRIITVVLCIFFLIFGERHFWQSCLLLSITAFQLHPNWKYSLFLFIPPLTFLMDEKKKDVYNVSQFIVLLIILLPYPLTRYNWELRSNMVIVSSMLCLIQEAVMFYERKLTRSANS